MEALQSRIDSFAKPKRVKGSSKSSKSTLKWPHPPTFTANAEALAEAGFYYNPSTEDKDNVTCFECGKQLSEWEESDDPFNLHWTKCGDKCSWAVVRCGLRGDMDRHGRFTFPDKTRLPVSKRMEKARLGTFAVGDGWAHDQSKNHGANSRKMAQAGFVWTPLLPGDDLATCLYCNISLSGWEKDDDPMEEHRKRVKPGTTCPFFAYNATGVIAQTPSVMSTASTATTSPTTQRLTRSTSAKPPSRAQPASSSRPTKTYKDMIQPVKEFDGSEEEDELDNLKGKQDEDDSSDAGLTVKLVKKPAVASKTRKSSRAPSARPSTRRLTHSESQPVPDSQHTRSKSQASNSKRAKTRALVDVEEEEESPDEIAEPANRHVSEEEEEERPAPSQSRTSRKPTKARGKSISRKKQKDIVAEELGSEDLEAPKRKTRKGIKGQTAEEKQEDDVPPPASQNIAEEEEEERPAPTRSRASSKPPRGRGGKTQSSRAKKEEQVAQALEAGNSRPKRGVRKQNVETEESAPEMTEGRGNDAIDTHEASERDEDIMMGYHYPDDVKNIEEKTAVSTNGESAVTISQPSKKQQVEVTVEVVEPMIEPRPAVPEQSEETATEGDVTQRLEEIPIDKLQDEKRKTSIQKATPPPNELFSLNFDNTPVPEKIYIPTPEATTKILSPVDPVVRNPEPQILPALSRIPFMPLQMLTDAELDMTVEEWIRYQMEIEFDKLKRDGERELGRFKAQAGEVRRMIEGL